MRRIITISLLISIGIFFSGCMAAAINYVKMPVERENIKDYKSDQISDVSKADMFVFMSKPTFTNKVSVVVDNKTLDSISSDFYLYFQVEPGYHWIFVQDSYNLRTKYICKNTQAGKKEIVDIIKVHKKLIPNDMDIKKEQLGEKFKYPRKQIKQKTNKLPDIFSYNGKIDSISIETTPNKNLNLIKDALQETFNDLEIPKGNALKVRVSLPNMLSTYKAPTIRYGRYMVRNTYYYSTAELQLVKLEFFIKDKKVEDYIAKGFFANNQGFIVNIASYIACKYFGKQYPFYKKTPDQGE